MDKSNNKKIILPSWGTKPNITNSNNNSSRNKPKIKNTNINVIILPKHVRNKTEPKLPSPSTPPQQHEPILTKPQKQVTDYFEESLNLFNKIHFYLDQSQKNNSNGLTHNMLMLKQHQHMKHNINVINVNKKKLTAVEKEMIVNDIEQSSKERKCKYNELFKLINESIVDIMDAIRKNNGVIKTYSKDILDGLSDIGNISEIKKLSSIIDEDTMLVGLERALSGSFFINKDELCDISDSAMEEHNKQFDNSNNKNNNKEQYSSVISENESSTIINNNDDLCTLSEDNNNSNSNSNNNKNSSNNECSYKNNSNSNNHIKSLNNHQLVIKPFSKPSSNIHSNIAKSKTQISPTISPKVCLVAPQSNNNNNTNNNNNCIIF